MLFAIIFVVGRSALSQEQRLVPQSEIVLRDELESDNSILQIECWRWPRQLKEETKRNRRLAFEAIYSKAAVKLKQTCSSREGTPATSYLLVENGKAKLIADYSRDRFGPVRVLTYPCEEVLVGSNDYDTEKSKWVFEPNIGKKEMRDKIPFFLCKSGTSELIF